MNTQERVSRLEALLARVQRNAQALRHERGAWEPGMGLSPDPTESSDTEGSQVAQPYRSQVKTLPPPATHPPPEPPVVSVSSGSRASVPSAASPFADDSREHTKPLWLGVESAPRAAEPHSAPSPESVTMTEASFSPQDASAVLSGDPGSAASDAGLPAELEALESSPPLSGERASTRSPLVAHGDEFSAPEAPVSLEEPLRSAPLGNMGPDSFSDAGESFDISTSGLDAPAEFVEDRESRISDAPASALGATISLPEDEAENVALELAEPPPSSLRLMSPAAPAVPEEDELEVELPRTSYRAAYDDTLSAPPKAMEELAAHDQSVQERLSSQPAARSVQPSPSRAPLTPPPEDDLPPVLSSRPHAPVHAASESHRDVDAPAAGVSFAPAPHQRAAEFEGRFSVAGSSFLSLLDESLALKIRG